MRIFLDTSGLIALSDRKDRNHTTARAYLKGRVQKGHGSYWAATYLWNILMA